jgi:preprotein translocase subunit SecA
MNDQREIIYGERIKVLTGQDLRENILSMLKSAIGRAVDLYAGQHESGEGWDLLGLNERLMPLFHKPALLLSQEEMETADKELVKEDLYEDAVKAY